MNILLVDDHELFREGLKLLLNHLDENLAFSEAHDCETALRMAAQDRFELVLLDYHLPRSQGLDVLKRLRSQMESATIVVLSAMEDPTVIRQCIDSGAAGFIPKTSSHAVMMAALRLILAGGVYLPPHALIAHPDPGTKTLSAENSCTLTERQLQILRRVMRGESNKTIAKLAEISEATVKAHLSQIYRELGVSSRSEAVYVAAQRGVVV